MNNVNTVISMQKNQSNNDPELLKSQLETMYIVRKCAILFAFLQLTTWAALGLIVLTPMLYLWTAIDSVINTWSSILHDKRYDRVYLYLCGCIAKTNKMRAILVAEHIDSAIGKEMVTATLSTPTVTTNSSEDFDGNKSSNII